MNLYRIPLKRVRHIVGRGPEAAAKLRAAIAVFRASKGSQAVHRARREKVAAELAAAKLQEAA